MIGQTGWLAAGFHLAIIVTVFFAAKLVFEFRHRFDWKGGGLGYAAFFAALVAVGSIHTFGLLAPHLLRLFGAKPQSAGFTLEIWPDFQQHFTLFTIGLIAVGLIVIAHAIRTLLATSEDREQNFRGFFDNAPLSMTLKDRDGRFLLINKVHESWFGLPEDAIIGKTVLEITGDTTLAERLAETEKVVLETNQVHQTEVQWHKEGGEIVDWIVTKFPITAPDGSFVCIGTFGTDVTERKRAERELSEKTALLQSILDGAPIYISLRDTQGRYVFVNKQVADHMGGQPENYIGRTLTDVYGDTSTKNLNAYAQAVLDSGQPRLNLEINPPGDPDIILRYSYLPVFKEDGEISGVLSIGMDITERNRTERELAEKSAFLQSILDAAPINISFRDKQGRYIFLNRRLTEFLGGQPEDYIGRKFSEVHPAGIDNTIESLLTEVVESKQPIFEREVVPRRRTDSVFRYTFVPMFKDDGDISGVLTMGQDVTEQLKAQAGKRTSEARLSGIVDIASDAIIVIDQDLRITTFNKGAEQTFGYAAADIIGQPLDMLIPKSFRATHSGHIANFGKSSDISRQMAARGEIAGLRKDGTTFPAEASISKLQLEAKTIFTIFLRDITESKKHETAIRDSEKNLRAILENSPIGVAIVSHDWVDSLVVTKRLFANDALVEMFGSPSAAQMVDADIVATWVDHNQFHAVNEKMKNHIDLVDFEVPRRHFDGTEFWISMNTRPVRFDGQDCTMVWHFDITERKQAADALKTSEERLRGIIDNSPVAIVLKDTQGRFLLANKKLRTWMNATDEDFFGETNYDFVPKETADLIAAHERLVIETGVPEAQERHLTFPDGITRTVWSHKFPIFGPDGKCNAVGTINLDVTEQRNIESQLRQAQKMEAVGQLTGGIAHDFNNLLGVVIGNLDYLVEGLQDNANLLVLAQAATKAALSGATLNRQLLAFSRKQNLSPEVIDLNEHIGGMFDMLRRTLGETIDIEAKQIQGPWTANVDPVQLQSAVLNLAVNARDAMPDGGTLTIETRKVRLDDEYAAARSEVTPGEYVMLAVTDTGTGMPPDVLAQVFEPIFTTKDIGKGSGLGLSMVFGFTKQSGGHVEIESAVSLGTTVTLYLPYTQPEPVSKAKKLMNIPRARDETVLLVEDDPDLLKLTSTLLDGLGYRVLRAKDGRSALAALADAERVDLLLTDVVMPGGMSGPALASKAETLQPTIKVLYMSGYAEDVMLSHPHRNVETALLRKPFRKPDLARMVRSVLDI
jgi:PAS domain S-box-containing protein